MKRYIDKIYSLDPLTNEELKHIELLSDNYKLLLIKIYNKSIDNANVYIMNLFDNFDRCEQCDEKKLEFDTKLYKILQFNYTPKERFIQEEPSVPPSVDPSVDPSITPFTPFYILNADPKGSASLNVIR
jgi:hypothetical protein